MFTLGKESEAADRKVARTARQAKAAANKRTEEEKRLLAKAVQWEKAPHAGPLDVSTYVTPSRSGMMPRCGECGNLHFLLPMRSPVLGRPWRSWRASGSGNGSDRTLEGGGAKGEGSEGSAAIDWVLREPRRRKSRKKWPNPYKGP